MAFVLPHLGRMASAAGRLIRWSGQCGSSGWRCRNQRLFPKAPGQPICRRRWRSLRHRYWERAWRACPRRI